MEQKKDISWIDEKIYYTYHSKKNKEALPKVIFFSIVFVFLNGAIIFEALLWGWYLWYCAENNAELNRNEKNLKDRQYYINLKQEHLDGKYDFLYKENNRDYYNY